MFYSFPQLIRSLLQCIFIKRSLNLLTFSVIKLTWLSCSLLLLSKGLFGDSSSVCRSSLGAEMSASPLDVNAL